MRVADFFKDSVVSVPRRRKVGCTSAWVSWILLDTSLQPCVGLRKGTGPRTGGKEAEEHRVGEGPCTGSPRGQLCPGKGWLPQSHGQRVSRRQLNEEVQKAANQLLSTPEASPGLWWLHEVWPGSRHKERVEGAVATETHSSTRGTESVTLLGFFSSSCYMTFTYVDLVISHIYLNSHWIFFM